MMRLRFYDAATGEKVFDHLYQALSEAHISVRDIPRIMKEIAAEFDIDEDMLACEVD